MGNKIYIIGAGAIGKALGVFLKLSGKDVCLIRGSVDHIPARVETISVLMGKEEVVQADLEVGSLSGHSAFEGVLVVSGKSYGNEHLAEALLTKAKNSPIVFFQNGLGVEAPFVERGFIALYRCVLFTTCQLVAENTVRFKPVTASPIGRINGTQEGLSYLLRLLDNAEFQFSGVENIQPVIWKKAIANCVFNSICPLLDTDNGVFLRLDGAMELAMKVIRECVYIAKLSGVEISVEEVTESVKMISKMSDGQLISTLQDIHNKRKTEIETLNFAVVALAGKLGKEAEVIHTKLLGELVKMKADLKSNPT